MDQECCLRCARESPKPGEKLVRISVVAELFQGSNVGADGNFLGIDPHGFGAALDDGPARARRLKTDENHLMARIGQAVKQMVQDASTSDHAARRDNDAGTSYVVDLARLFLLRREVKAFPGCRRAVLRNQLARFLVV